MGLAHDSVIKHTHVRLDRSATMDDERISAIASRHGSGNPSIHCDHGDDPCDAAELAAELARVRAWADFASDLLDAHIWGFRSGDWQAGDALAHALVGSDWPPEWSRDPEDAAHIVVDPDRWPTVGRLHTVEGVEVTDADLERMAAEAEQGFDLSTWVRRSRG